jgi:transposase
MADQALAALSPRFDALYSKIGRPSIPPEQLLRALLIEKLYSVRSERMLMEQINYNILFRWFVGLEIDDPIWVPTVFSKNRERLLKGDIARAFFEHVVEQARQAGLVSDEHLTVDGTMIEASAGQKSFRKKGEPPRGAGSGQGGFRGEKRSNATHESTTDPDAKLYRKSGGAEAKLAYLGHVLMDNRNDLAVGGALTQATGTAERDAATELAAAIRGNRRVTLGADKAYDVREFVAGLRALHVVPHVAQNTTNRRSAIDRRTTRHVGYAQSQAKRPAIERIPAWLKGVALLRKTRHRGTQRVGWAFMLGLAAYNLVRMHALLPGSP